jgi:hypothetical protein
MALILTSELEPRGLYYFPIIDDPQEIFRFIDFGTPASLRSGATRAATPKP